MLKDESMTEAVTHPIWATSVTTFSSSVTQIGVQKRDKRIKSEKEINRSESRQSWSGVGQFNSFVCVYARCTAWALICTLLLNVCVKVMSRNLLGP